MKRPALHWQIMIGMITGGLLGYFSAVFGFSHVVIDFVKPFGDIFVNALKLLALPLILFSLVSAIVNLGDSKNLGRFGLKTVIAYIFTTVLAVSIGLVTVNLVQPGNGFSEEAKASFQEQYHDQLQSKVKDAELVKDAGPLQFLVDIVPSNIFGAMTSNKNMLQVIFFAVLIGIALLIIPNNKGKPVIDVFDSLFEVTIKMILLVMKYAPIGVLGLLSGVIAEFIGDNPEKTSELLGSLVMYGGSVIVGLGILIFLIYPVIVKATTGVGYRKFLAGIGEAQIMAFTTSSSAATLPITMKNVEKNLGVKKEISSFVLPMGATVNMDGTSLFQAVSAIFIAQVYGIDLSFMEQIGIVITCTLASIGAAAVPGAGTVMLVIVLEQAGLPIGGLALIFAVDRILDMCRTVVNVTGDAMISMIIAKGEGMLDVPIKKKKK